MVINAVIVCWIILFLYWLVSAFFVKQSATKRDWRAQLIWRAIVIVLVVLFFKFYRPSAISLFTFLFQSFLSYAIVGITLTVLGLITAIWARISLGRNWSNYDTYKKEHELITTGPYSIMRHPIYSGAILMLIGTFLYYGYLFILIILVMAVIFVASRIVGEEKTMIKLFGKRYTDYMKKTKRLVPFVW